MTPSLPLKAPGKGSWPRDPALFRGVISVPEARGHPAGGGRTDGTAAAVAVAGKDIANLAEAATEGGWTRASLPTAAAEIDAESDNVLLVEGLAAAGQERLQGHQHLEMYLFPALEAGTEAHSSWLTSESLLVAPGWQLRDSCPPSST